MDGSGKLEVLGHPEEKNSSVVVGGLEVVTELDVGDLLVSGPVLDSLKSLPDRPATGRVHLGKT